MRDQKTESVINGLSPQQEIVEEVTQAEKTVPEPKKSEALQKAEAKLLVCAETYQTIE